MRLLILILSGPFIALSRIAELWNICGIRTEITSCLDVVDSSRGKVPFPFLVSLITAEDHRSALHQGVDPIAMARAAYVRIRYGRVQGASTVEQQFVRVVTGRYDRTVSRKVREQILAIAVSRHRSKLQIASAYLSIAFYGSGCIGIKGLCNRCGNNLSGAEQNDIWGMISRLKYPEPSQPSTNWKMKLHHRIEYISCREAKSANNWLKPTAYVAGAPSASA
ncbi:MAG: transglycosylase domain-containing protein [Xanthomonadales bacterium]|nr:transglycosylase domain-containing protein [Xanthomonadales bacterium]